MKELPRYPIYIPSKGRWQADNALTVKNLVRDGVDFRVVVEPQERDEYVELVGDERVLVLPFSNLGQGSIPARNWIKDHAVEHGAARHWQLDDNIIQFRRRWTDGNRIPCDSALALRVCEDFTDRYENIGISGLAYQMFVTRDTPVPYYLNVHVYSCTLINNAIPQRWRGRYNEDTDICLQVLAAGWCTVLINVFMANKLTTMVMGGGNTDELYSGDGRLKMARELERAWPGVVKVSRRYGRPQHVIDWRKFKSPLVRCADVDFDALADVDEYGAKMMAIKEIKSPRLQALLEDANAES